MAVDMDLEQGRVHVPNLDIAALGITLKGNVAASRLNAGDADLAGEVALEGKDLGRLLQALNQPALAICWIPSPDRCGSMETTGT